jgi:Ras GTPase-activating-like protein IQGAP2/3
LAAQFETSTEFGSLLRANTPVSRMMTTYTRRGPGQTYLKSILADNVTKLVENQNDLNLEINPLKVYEQMVAQIEIETGSLPADLPRSVTPEVANSNADVQNIIQPRLEKLIQLADDFLTTIISSTPTVPYGIRWICKQIRSLTKRKNPEASDYSICSMIGGFFFLRFINPAIVTPRAYMLLDVVPGNAPRRTLTLVRRMNI